MRKPTKTRGRKTKKSSRGKKKWPVGVPRPVDIHVGSRLRLRRTLLGLSQGKLGEAVGLTFQQIQKYERGANRVGASRLFEFSRILDVTISYFFEEMGKDDKSRPALELSDQPQLPIDPGSMSRRETLELVRAYYRIDDPGVRKRVYDLIKSIAKTGI